MNKCYLLLRNNKETGPLTITELLQLSLTDNDLVWVQGKSAGWRYPSDINELKESIIKKNMPSDPVVIAMKEPPGVGQPKEQSIGPKKVFVSLPSAVKKQAAAITPSFEEKAEAIRQKALNFSGNKKDPTEVKYARSLNDIKKEYSGWIKQQKKQRKRLIINKPVAFTTLFVAITTAAFFVLQWNPKKEKSGQVFTPASKKTMPVTNRQTNNTVTYKVLQEKPDVTTDKIPKQKLSEEVFERVIAKPSLIKRPLSTTVKMKEQPSVPVKKESIIRQKEATVPITDLIETTSQYIQSKEGIGLSISLYNKSGKSVRVAAIDVLYFDKAKVQMGKETLYFISVQPGSTLTKNSSFVKAASASYRIGLVSAESTGLYVMQ
jgi:hypothetical protein